MATTSRTAVRQGIAAYFGGTLNTNIKAYQGGPLSTLGLGAVRAGYPREVNQEDSFAGMAPGSMSGCQMVVALENDTEVRGGIAGAPVLSGPNIVAGGIKQVRYDCVLDSYFMSFEEHHEDAQAFLDILIEAMKQQIRVDRTLGGICMDAGETSKGIVTKIGHPSQFDNQTMGIWFTIAFQVRVEFIG